MSCHSIIFSFYRVPFDVYYDLIFSVQACPCFSGEYRAFFSLPRCLGIIEHQMIIDVDPHIVHIDHRMPVSIVVTDVIVSEESQPSVLCLLVHSRSAVGDYVPCLFRKLYLPSVSGICDRDVYEISRRIVILESFFIPVA